MILEGNFVVLHINNFLIRFFRFGGSYAHDAHILYTLSAIQVLVLCNSLDMIDKDKVANYIASLQLPDGSFQGDHWGEVDTRFSYCALNAMALLQKFDSGLINIDKAVEYILRYFYKFYLFYVF